MEQMNYDDQRALKATGKVLMDALTFNAEQVQLNPNPNRTYTVGLVQNGEFISHDELPEGLARAVMSRFKIMCCMDLRSTEPQEGRLFFPQDENGKDWRIDTQPTPNGERMLLSVTEDLDGTKELLRGSEGD